MGRNRIHATDTTALVRIAPGLLAELETWAQEEGYPAGFLEHAPNVVSRNTIITRELARALEAHKAKVGLDQVGRVTQIESRSFIQ